MFPIVRLEEAEQLVLHVRVAAEDARAGLPHHVLDARHEGLQLAPQAVERRLVHHIGGTFHARGNLRWVDAAR